MQKALMEITRLWLRCTIRLLSKAMDIYNKMFCDLEWRMTFIPQSKGNEEAPSNFPKNDDDDDGDGEVD